MFDFVGRYVLSLEMWNPHDLPQFIEVIKYLAQRGGTVLEENLHLSHSAAWMERQLIPTVHQTLLKTPAALDYVTKTRGWQLTTVKSARIGYMFADKRELPDKWRNVIHKFPPRSWQ